MHGMRQISKYMDKLTISLNLGESNNHTRISHVVVIYKMKQNAKKPLSDLGEANDHTIHSKFNLLMRYLIWTKKIISQMSDPILYKNFLYTAARRAIAQEFPIHCL